MTDERPLRPIGLREIWRNPGHCGVQVFVGRNPQARGNAGEITLRTDEWDELRDRMAEGDVIDAEIIPSITHLRPHDTRTFGDA